EMANIAHEHQMWFHVDAAYGGSLLFEPSQSRYLKGIELADSVTWDLHKMMGIPLICASFLVKHPGLLENSLNVSADYLFREDSSEYELGKKSLQCGRRIDSFKLWLTWQAE